MKTLRYVDCVDYVGYVDCVDCVSCYDLLEEIRCIRVHPRTNELTIKQHNENQSAAASQII